MNKKTFERIEVVNAFKSFHICYIANMMRVIKELSRLFKIKDLDIRVLSALVDLTDRLRSGKRYNYATGERIAYWLGYNGTRPYTIYKSLARLTEKGFIILQEEKVNARGTVSKRYILSPDGFVVCSMYASLMSKYYTSNYFSAKVDKRIKARYGLMGFKDKF